MPPTATPAGKTGGPLRIGTRVDPQSLDPHHYKAGGIDMAILDLVIDGLVTFDRQMKMVPQLALSWEWTDNTTLRFKLRQGVTFHDGTPFNAQAAKVNLDRMAQAAEVKGYYGQLASTTVIDEYTIQLKLSAPFAPFLSNLGIAGGRHDQPGGHHQMG